jgi:hypothetical protein
MLSIHEIRTECNMINDVGLRPIIFSVNCWLATILALFIAFSLDLKSPAWAMTTVYPTSQPLSGVMRAKAVYRAIGTCIGGVAMVAIVPNLVNAPELTTLAIILWVALCVFVSLLDRTPRSYMFVLAGYTAALIGFPSVLAPGLRYFQTRKPVSDRGRQAAIIGSFTGNHAKDAENDSMLPDLPVSSTWFLLTPCLPGLISP